MTPLQKFFIGLGMAASLGAASAAYAADGPGAGPGPGPGKFRGNCMQEDGLGGMRGANVPDLVDKRLDKIRNDLKITDAQQAAWQTFATRTKQQATEMQALREKMRQGCPAQGASAAPTPAPERLEKAIDFMKQRVGHLEAELAAVKDLYAALTPEQRTIADKVLGHRGDRRGEGMMHRRRR